jgi:dienelactone hydrolase
MWPEPERWPLNAHIGGRIEYDDYTIETVYFESWPGFYCTGNLYRPRTVTGRVPGVLHPHGHWQKGRLEHQPLGSIRARCITMARMGMVSFAYDMVGYNDSLQVPSHAACSLRGSLWGYSHMALQTWNSRRGVDFLLSLPEVDPERIGCTGASGGGTQTFIVCALEPRIKVAAPVNMISSIMQGGCSCENTPGLRTQTYNVEIGALMAPRPLLMVSATGDWTVNTPLVEYPAIRSVYQLYGAAERVAQLQVDAPHNYNAASRAAVYRWFARWFLGDEALGEGVEHDLVVEPDERMRVFKGAQLPSEARTPEQVQHDFVERAEQRLAALFPKRREDLERLRQVTEPRLRETLEAVWPDPAAVLAIEAEATMGPAGRQIPLILARRGVAERIAGTLYLPTEGTAQRYALLVHGAGHTALEDGYGRAGEAIVALRDAGWGVLTIDAFYTGDVPANAVPWRRDWFWLTFNPTLVGQRVQDILTALAWLDGRSAGGELALVGLGAAGSWGVWAGALCPRDLRLALDLDGLGAQQDASYLGELYAPNLRAYGDLRAAGALLAPRALMLGGTQRCALHWLESAYQAAGALDRLQVFEALSPNELRRLGAVR